MKKYFLALPVLYFIVALTSCQKTISGGPISSLNIINANPAQPSLYVYLTNVDSAFYNQQAIVYYASVVEYGVPASPSSPVTLVNTSDTTQRVFQSSFNLKSGGIYSLYLLPSASQTSFDTLFMQDFIPVHSDSTAGLRIINLVIDGGALSVNLADSTFTDFNAVNYKSITAFKNYPVSLDLINNGGYNFEIKDVMGNILNTFNWYDVLPYKNYTLVLSGSVADVTLQAFEVHNF